MAGLGIPRTHGGAGRLALASQDLALASAEHERIGQQVIRQQGRREQLVIDAEVRDTRRLLLQALRRRHGADATAFLDEDFLALADRPAIVHAILVSAVTAGAAAACDLRLYDPETEDLRLEAAHGFTGASAAIFAGTDRAPPAARAAQSTRTMVLADDTDHSPVSERIRGLHQMRAAGFRAVRAYPLLTEDGDIYGVLSLYYRQPAPRPDLPDLIAAGAGRALRDHSGQQQPRTRKTQASPACHRQAAEADAQPQPAIPAHSETATSRSQGRAAS